MATNKRPFKRYLDVLPFGKGHLEHRVGKVGKKKATCRCHELPLSNLATHEIRKGTLAYKARYKGKRGDITLYICVKCLDLYLDFIDAAREAAKDTSREESTVTAHHK
jgi:hypothetical protein